MSTIRILFLISFFIACTPENKDTVSIRWENNKATALRIPASLLNGNATPYDLKVQLLQPGERSAILGEIKSESDHVLFEPLVPLTRGLRYEILFNDSVIAEIEIPKSESAAPELLGIYPSQDTVPENLLKVYFHFSQSMMEGRSLSYMTVMNEDDTLNGTFLALEHELWNTDGTMLTVWLDPGRIKRDLIPNREMGSPLKAGKKYTITISSNWKSKEGIPLSSSYSKTFATAWRDEKIPVTGQWKITPPSSNTKASLKIDLQESLDYSLLHESISILDEKKNLVSGAVQLSDEEKTFRFTPHEPWKTGSYEIQIESRLEDLCGNNLNRPFDRDITKVKTSEQKFFTRSFTIP